MQNNTHYTPLAFTRGAIAFYTVIITLNNPLIQVKICTAVDKEIQELANEE